MIEYSDYMKGFINSHPMAMISPCNYENTLYWNLLLHSDISTSMEIHEIFLSYYNGQQKS
jgi:hypothetical protein